MPNPGDKTVEECVCGLLGGVWCLMAVYAEHIKKSSETQCLLTKNAHKCTKTHRKKDTAYNPITFFSIRVIHW